MIYMYIQMAWAMHELKERQYSPYTFYTNKHVLWWESPLQVLVNLFILLLYLYVLIKGYLFSYFKYSIQFGMKAAFSNLVLSDSSTVACEYLVTLYLHPVGNRFGVQISCDSEYGSKFKLCRSLGVYLVYRISKLTIAWH